MRGVFCAFAFFGRDDAVSETVFISGVERGFLQRFHVSVGKRLRARGKMPEKRRPRDARLSSVGQKNRARTGIHNK